MQIFLSSQMLCGVGCDLGAAEGTSKAKGWAKLAQNLTMCGRWG